MTATVQKRWHGGALAAVAAAAVVMLAGCGKPANAAGSTPAASSKAALEAQQLKFTQCMRAHGANVQDAKPNTSGGGVNLKITGNGADKGAMDAAMQACSKYLPKAGGPPADPAQRQQMLDRALKFSQCMRQHGVDLPDPQMSSDGNGIIMQGGPGGGIDPSSKTFQDAQHACQQYFGPPGGKGDQGPSVSTQGKGGGGSGVVIGNG
jgi:hypothetical protein